jgi:hypothetical protein
VPAYAKFVQERFERCLDLYLCPRARKKRLNVDPDSLLPKLPKPKDPMPFPTWQSLLVRTHLASPSPRRQSSEPGVFHRRCTLEAAPQLGGANYQRA